VKRLRRNVSGSCARVGESRRLLALACLHVRLSMRYARARIVREKRERDERKGGERFRRKRLRPVDFIQI